VARASARDLGKLLSADLALWPSVESFSFCVIAGELAAPKSLVLGWFGLDDSCYSPLESSKFSALREYWDLVALIERHFCSRVHATEIVRTLSALLIYTPHRPIAINAIIAMLLLSARSRLLGAGLHIRALASSNITPGGVLLAASRLKTRSCTPNSRLYSQHSGQRPRFSSRLRTALNNSKIQWFHIPVGLGIGFLGAVQFYRVSKREKERQELESEDGLPTRRPRVRPEGPW
jgi:hypothetical protein